MVNMLAGVIYGGISEIEVFWVLLATFGFAFSLYNVRDAWNEIRALDKAGVRNGRRLIAKTQRFQDGARAICHLIFLGIGLISWTLNDAPLESLPLNIVIATILIRWGLITAAGVLVAQSYASYHLRRAILEQERHFLELSSSIEE